MPQNWLPHWFICIKMVILGSHLTTKPERLSQLSRSPEVRLEWKRCHHNDRPVTHLFGRWVWKLGLPSKFFNPMDSKWLESWKFYGNLWKFYGNFMEIYGNLWKCWKMLNFKLLLNFESIAMPHFEHNIAQRFSPFALGRSSNNALARCRSSKSPHRIAFRPPVAQGQLGQNSWSWLVFNIMLYV